MKLKLSLQDKDFFFLRSTLRVQGFDIFLGPSGIGVDKSDQTLEWALFSWPQTHSCHFSFVQRQRRHLAEKSTSSGHQHVHH